MSETGRVRRLVEGIHSLLLLGLGFGYFAFEIVDKFWKDADRPTLILLNMVATLCFVLGLERFTTISLLREKVEELGKKRTDQLDLLERRVAEVLGIRLIKGKGSVYGDAARLACTANHFIRALMWIPTSTPPAPAPPEFAKAIADHLIRNRGVNYEVVLAVDVPRLDSRFWRGNDERINIYKAQGVDSRVQLKILATSRPLGFDILLVDDKHVTFAFAPTPGTSEREMSIHFENQPEIAQEIGRWLQKTTGDAVPYAQMRPH